MAAGAATSWQNAANPLDVNNDEIVSPLDALALATEWGRTGPGPLNTLAADAHRPMVYVDVDGDGSLSIQDFDAVVAYLNSPVHRSDAAGYADGEAGLRGPDENPPSSSRFPRAVSASRHDAGVQLSEDLIFAIDVGNGPTRQFQLMRAGLHNQAHASGGALDAASDRLQADVPASPAATDGRADRYHDQAAERIERATERLLGRDFAQANAKLLRSLPVIDQLAGALAAGEGTSVRAGKVAGRSVAAWSLAGAGRAAASAAAGEGEYWNTPPVAEDDYYDLLHDTEILETAPGVMWNDWDDDGDTITAVLDQGPTNQDPNDPNSFWLNADGSFFYRPKRDWAGEDQFTYYVTDGNDVSGTAIVRLYVHNTPPWAEDDHYEMVHDSTLDEPAPGVLGNDSEDDDDPVTAILVSGPGHADTFAFNSNGSFSYAAGYHYVGTDTFTYKVNDKIADSNIATVTIDVRNSAPVAEDGWETAEPDQPIFSSASAWDDDGESLTFAVVASPANGTLNLSADGSFEYFPNPGFLGTDSFEFSASDGIASDNGVFYVTFQDQALAEVEITLESSINGRTTPAGPAEVKDGSLEGDDLVFAVTVTPPAGQNALPNQVTVNYQTQDGTATIADGDYTNTAGVLTFPVGAQGAALTQQVNVATGNDRDVEPDEAMTMRLVGAANANIAPASASAAGVVRNNDVDITMMDASDTEGGQNGGNHSVEVRLLGNGVDSARKNGLDVQLVGNTDDGTATLVDNDYQQVVNHETNVVSDTNQTVVRITFIDDPRDEPHEFLFYEVVLGGGTSAKAQVDLARAVSKVTILDDDP